MMNANKHLVTLFKKLPFAQLELKATPVLVRYVITVPIDEILSVKNARAWVSINGFILKK